MGNKHYEKLGRLERISQDYNRIKNDTNMLINTAKNLEGSIKYKYDIYVNCKNRANKQAYLNEVQHYNNIVRQIERNKIKLANLESRYNIELMREH